MGQKAGKKKGEKASKASAAKSARAGALELLWQVEKGGEHAGPLLGRLLEKGELSPLDKGLAHELVYGVLRWRGRLDWIIESVSDRPMAEMTSWIRNILRLGAYQLLFSQKIPPAATVHESVKLAYRYGHRGTAGFVNAILRAIQRCGDRVSWPDGEKDLVRYLSVFYSHPDWLIRRWLGRYGVARTVEIALANNTPPPLTIRTNTLRTSRETLKLALQAERVEVEEGVVAPEALRLRSALPISQVAAFRNGWLQVQDESSILVAHLLSPRPGDRVLDACAGRGGKTTHLAQLMNNRGEIWAVDVHRGRLKELEEACARLHVEIARTLVRDMAEKNPDLGRFDAVLVDAPCSGLGVIRRHPEARWLKGEADLTRFQELQRRILHGAQGCVKQGAALVYGVCSLEPEEGRWVIDRFLDDHAGFELEDPRRYLPGAGEGWECHENTVSIVPSRSVAMDGFFAARLRRRS